MLRPWLKVVLFSTALPCAASAQDGGDPREGQLLAREICAQCHAVGRGETRSPAADAPSFERIANVPGMTGLALTVALQTSHKTMPNLMFEPAELRNVVADILSLKAGR